MANVAWDMLRQNYKPDGKGRYNTVDAMKVASQLADEVERLKIELEACKKKLDGPLEWTENYGQGSEPWLEDDEK
jgi:hypothetical protein